MSLTIDRIILGSNAFEGVSYLSRTQSVHYLEHFGREDNVVAILEAARTAGVRSFMLSNTGNIMAALAKFDGAKEMRLLPVIPNAYEYAMEASERGVLGAVLHKAAAISTYQKLRLGLRALTKIKSVITRDVMDLLLELLHLEMASFEKYTLGAVLLHGQITDLALSSGNPDIIATFQDLIRENFGVEPILATHNFGTLVPQLKAWGIDIPVMAAFNPKGFMMKPSKEECESVLRETGWTLIAKKVMAAGRITPEEGLPYVAGLPNLAAAVFGIGSVSEAYHTFAVAKQHLKP